MSERKGILPPFDFPVTKFAALEKEFECNWLPWLTDRSGALHCEPCLIIAFVGAEHGQIVV